MKSLFISKEEGEITAYLERLRALGYHVQGTSFLEFVPVYSTIQKSFDVLFFSSPRSVIFYLGQHPIPSGTQLACAGSGTAEILSSMGYTADFIGTKSGDMDSVAQMFKDWCATRRILFPVSNRSLGTVSKVFAAEQKEELVVYETRQRRIKVPDFSHYAFTSPSNVEAFLMDNVLPESCTVIAWGKSTAAALQSAGFAVQHTLAHGSMDELIEILR